MRFSERDSHPYLVISVCLIRTMVKGGDLNHVLPYQI